MEKKSEDFMFSTVGLFSWTLGILSTLLTLAIGAYFLLQKMLDPFSGILVLERSNAVLVTSVLMTLFVIYLFSRIVSFKRNTDSFKALLGAILLVLALLLLPCLTFSEKIAVYMLTPS